MKIIVLCGPTATGKTALAICLAKKLGCEIVSADSIQVYRGLNIGSAKPTVSEMAAVRHHLIDVMDVVDGDFSVSRYKMLADEAIKDIVSRGKTPLIVGGTGLYINALTYPLGFTAVPPDEQTRRDLTEQERLSPGSLYARLKEADPQRAKELHQNDIKRIVRSLEVYILSGRTYTSFGNDFANAQNALPPYDACLLGLTMNRAELYSRIEERVDTMMKNGLLDEVKRYRDCKKELPALQGLGYKQFLSHLRGEITLEEAVDQVKRETRRFAKRQWTWFNRDKRIKWFDAANEDCFMQAMNYLSDKGFNEL